MSPLKYYQELLASKQIEANPQQQFAMQKLDDLYYQLAPPSTHLFTKVKSFLIKKLPIQGIYLWGSVGVGKSFLMDIFYSCLPFPQKLRQHFHEFMLQVHGQLQNLQGQKDPLGLIAKQLAQQAKIICFDELTVTNIVDAMLLGELFKALFSEKVLLVFTSNAAPDQLYNNGLQRQRFLPAIELIKQHNTIINLTAAYDYRSVHALHDQFFIVPSNAMAAAKLEEYFAIFSQHAPVDATAISLYDRSVRIVKRADSVIWFNFLDLCGVPRSQADYLALSKHYHTILISDLKSILPSQNDLIESFIKLIDVLYDAKLRLIISSDVTIDVIYPTGRLSQFFARTRSRLIEMQSLEWQTKCKELFCK